MKPRILFVDDEPRILDAFKNLFWKDRNRWEMVFADDGEKAIEQIKTAPFDLIISDICMPRMGGVEFLTEVDFRYASVVRIILSGYAGRETMLKAIPVAHQYLAKPCDPGSLRQTIERALGLQNGLDSPGLLNLVRKITKLPTVPRIYNQLTAALANPKSRVDDIAEIVKSDPALTIRVLQLANSSSFGSGTQVTAISEATRILGNDLLKGLALVGNILSMMDHKIKDFSVDHLQENWIRSAELAKRFLSQSKQSEAAFTSALIRDIGLVIIAHQLQQEFEQIIKEKKASGLPLHVVERKILGTSHAELGAYLISTWGLPFSLVESVAYHHTPSQKLQGPYELLSAVHVAGAVVDSWDAHSQPLALMDIEFLKARELFEKCQEWTAEAEKYRLAVS